MGLTDPATDQDLQSQPSPGVTAIAAILALAIALRIGWALLVPVQPVSDASMYHVFAQEIAAGRGYTFPQGGPTVYWPVGPAAFYALFYRLFGDGGWTVVAANTLLSGLLVIGLYRLGLACFDRTVALVAALIFALWPAWIEFTTVPSSELPFVALLVWAFVLRAPGHGRALWTVALSTALLVGAAFMRPTALPLIVLLPLLDGLRAVRSGGFGQLALRLVVALVVAAALLGPWAERNRALFGQPVLISANFGSNLWMGNNPQSEGAYMELPEVGITNEVQRDAHFKAVALGFIRENPAAYLGLCLKRIGHSFDRESIGVAWNEAALPEAWQAPLKGVSAAYWLAIFAASLGGVGLFLYRRPANLFDPLIAAPAMFASVALLVVGQDRYHMPMMPFIALFAAYLLQTAASFRAQPRPAPDA